MDDGSVIRHAHSALDLLRYVPREAGRSFSDEWPNLNPNPSPRELKSTIFREFWVSGFDEATSHTKLMYQKFPPKTKNYYRQSEVKVFEIY